MNSSYMYSVCSVSVVPMPYVGDSLYTRRSATLPDAANTCAHIDQEIELRAVGRAGQVIVFASTSHDFAKLADCEAAWLLAHFDR